MSKVTKKIEEFERTVSEVAGKYKNSNIDFVFNKALYKQSEEYKMIVVADNPGLKELQEGVYLIGQAGQICRNFLTNNGLIEDFDKDCLVLNKTYIHSKQTMDLHGTDYEILKETQIYMARMMFEIHKEKKVPVFIFGLSGCCDSNGKWLLKRESNFMRHYFLELAELYKNEPELWEQVYILNHPSYGSLSKGLEKITKENPELEGKSCMDKLTALSGFYKKYFPI